MNNKQELNKLASKYSQEADERVFNEIYRILSAQWMAKFGPLSKKLWTSPQDVRASYEDTLLKTLAKYDGKRPFENLLNHNLKNARARLYSTSKRYREREPLIVDWAVDYSDDEDDRAAHDIVDDETTESRYLEGQTKSDQRQLIASLLNDPVKVDATTIEIVEAFPKYKSITALAKALGLHHEVVKRKLRKLAANFDAESFGDYRDYLSVS